MDGCYHALDDGHDGGLMNPYFLDGVSNVDAYLSVVDGYLTETTDFDLGPVVYIDPTAWFLRDDDVSESVVPST